ncbi:MAG: virulence RhuM family protein [Burkholderiales bacterium]|nr:virulence RhuM family protein [Burkholderiales bacterium]
MNSELIIYETEDGNTQITLKAVDGTVWLTQKEIATLFDRDVRTINEHLKTIFADNELQEYSVIRNFRITAADGKSYNTAHYNLEAILSVGYRVRSPRGIQFRKWASTILKEYLIKGFAMDDDRLKQVKQWDYFDEWLARIREIRASEKRFYQKIKDLYITAVDYNKDSNQAKLFFKKVQNKMLWAVTGHTAAEIIASRSNPGLPNMGLTSWMGSKVRKIDVDTAKNYLSQEEINELNRIVIMYLDYAEDQAYKRKALTMAEWEQKLEAFLSFNERELLTHAGTIRANVAKQLAKERYDLFDKHRQNQELEQANTDDLAQLEQIAKQIKKGNEYEQ